MAVRYRNITEEKRQEIIHTLKVFFEKYNEIIFAYLHGSFAEELPFRDIDVAVYVDGNAVSKDDAVDYGIKLTAEAEMETQIIPLDVKVINYTPVGFKYYATKGILLFSKNDDMRCNFLENTWKKYFDLSPKWKQVLLDLVSHE